jgi:hypothetical protein
MLKGRFEDNYKNLDTDPKFKTNVEDFEKVLQNIKRHFLNVNLFYILKCNLSAPCSALKIRFFWHLIFQINFVGLPETTEK